MAKAASDHDGMLDALLQHIKDELGEMNVNSSEPTTYAEATTTYMLADVAVDDTDVTGPGVGDAGGRKITITQQADILIDSSGTALHVSLTDGVDTLLLVTTCTSQALVANGSNTVTVPAWDIEADIDTVT